MPIILVPSLELGAEHLFEDKTDRCQFHEILAAAQKHEKQQGLRPTMNEGKLIEYLIQTGKPLLQGVAEAHAHLSVLGHIKSSHCPIRPSRGDGPML